MQVGNGYGGFTRNFISRNPNHLAVRIGVALAASQFSLPCTHLAIVVRHGFLILILHHVLFSHFVFLSSSYVTLLCTPFLSSCFPLSSWFFLFFHYANKCGSWTCVMASKCVCGWSSMSLVTWKPLANPMSILLVPGCNVWPMKSWWKIWSIHKERFG